MSELNKSEIADQSVQKRRVFLKKASMASLIVALPTKSVWGTAMGNGCTVSGNMSGNTSQNNPNATCVQKGWSPGGWKRSDRVDSYGDIKWNDVFGYRVPFTRSSGTQSNGSDKLREFLPNIGTDSFRGSNNANRHLVAAYMNAKHGFYGQLTVSAENYVCALYDEIERVGGPDSAAGQDIIAAIEATYD